MLSDAEESKTFEKAWFHEQKDKWQQAMQEEIDFLHMNNTYD